MTLPALGPQRTVVLRRDEVRELLEMRACIEAVEHAFRQHAHGQSITPGVLGTHVEGGGFHVKTAGLLADGSATSRPLFAAKVNANFPGNPASNGLPTIQGVIALFDAGDGRLLALLDSMEITSIRTAAATGVAAKYLAAPDGSIVTICGCGEQSRHQLRALACVRQLRRVMAFDVRFDRAESLATDMSAELEIDVVPVRALGHETAESDMWITCTPAQRWFLGRSHVTPGAFVAAVGADNPHKQEIEPDLLASSAVVTDILDQCATIGDLHHALDAGVMRREDVRAELADVVAGRKPGRLTAEEIVIFDSTGTALQDVAAAAVVYERARSAGVGASIELGYSSRGATGHTTGATR
jgi:ornithine cyclodeaminase/alanine dehydrogenase-like protein (mu-crystallin family)